MIKRYQTFITIILTLGALEFFTATAFIFFIDPDPKNAVFLGYSAVRWAIAMIAISSGMISLYLAYRIHQQGLSDRIANTLTQYSSTLQPASIALFIIGVIILLSPSDLMGKNAEYFVRLRPLLIVVATLPFQFSIPAIFRLDSGPETDLVKYTRTTFGVLIILAGFIVLTRLGLEPDPKSLDKAGIPLTALELLIVFLITTSFHYLINKVSIFKRLSPATINLCMALFLYVVGIWIWSQTPMLKHYNALRPAPPAFQYFPTLDARVHDFGAHSIVRGYGIYFGSYTDKPLYMVLLSILHRMAGNNYNTLSLYHLYLMGLILPFIFQLGTQLYNRQLGIAITLIILIRQRNAILFAHLLSTTNPRLLLTELPTLLGLIPLCTFFFFWIKKNQTDEHDWSHSLLVGGVLGAVSLIRLNPIGLLPVVLFVGAMALKKSHTNWIPQILICMLGFLITITPWVFTGRDPQGTPYLWVKFLDVINVRYFDNSQNIEPEQPRLPETLMTASIMGLNPDGMDYLIDAQKFPGFVINHALHNAIASFLALPDSFSQKDQSFDNLLQKPYLNETSIWLGDLQPGQLPFLVVNLFLIALGLGWSWSRWKWAGISPVCIFIGYSFALGLARTSGSRYIVPVDWIVFLYYMIGLMYLLEKITTIFENTPDKPLPLKPNERIKSVSPVVRVLSVFILSTLILIAQKPIITQKFPVCNNHIDNSAYPELKLIKGEVFYPYVDKKDFSFVFFPCDKRTNISIKNFDGTLQNGQTVIIGFPTIRSSQPSVIFLQTDSILEQVWIKK